MVAALGSVWMVRRSFPQTTGTVSVAGLSASVEVRRDARGVPHVYADDPDDLFFAQGYVHAQDRFWEMDFRRHYTAGRLAEMFGADVLPADRFLRTLGWHRVAAAELEILSPETVAALEAYADGVNAYLEGRSESDVSLEYAILGLQNAGYRIEPWEPVDSVAWLKAMAWDSRSNISEEIDRVRIAAQVGGQRAEELYPEYPYDRYPPALRDFRLRQTADVTDPGPGSDPPPLPDGAPAVLDRVATALAQVPALLGSDSAGLGSNAWAISGSLTDTGGAILAADPHMAPSLPSVWHQMGLHCRTVSPECPYDVAGVTFSGVPGVIIGRNADIAWGFTNLSGDASDLYLEQLEGDGVVVDGVVVRFVTREEVLEVAGGDAETMTVRSTANGPLLSDVDEFLLEIAEDSPGVAGRGDLGVSLRWTALTPGRTADAIFVLNAASTFEDFREAARLFEVPASNMVYADASGNIGYQAPGVFPVRGKGDGRWPAPGWDSAYGWVGVVPFEDLPSALNPERGYIVSANQPPIDLGEYPHWLGEDFGYGIRAGRLDAVLSSRDDWTVEATARLQTDSHSAVGELLLPHLMQVEGLDATATAAQALLVEWDLQQDAGSAGAAYLNAVWRQLLQRLFVDELGEEIGVHGQARDFEVVRNLWGEPDDAWWDDVATPDVEDRDATVHAAMQAAADELAEALGPDPQRWEWGRLHRLDLVSQTFGSSGITILERLFNRGPLRVGGGTAAVNAIQWSASAGYETDWVPSMRMVADLSTPDASRWVNLTGASGHAFHPHYWDQARLWRDGETIPMPFTRSAVEAATNALLTLRPRPPVTG